MTGYGCNNSNAVVPSAAIVMVRNEYSETLFLPDYTCGWTIADELGHSMTGHTTKPSDAYMRQ